MRGGRSIFVTVCCALVLWAATWMTLVSAEDNLPVAAGGNIVLLPWRCGGYVALPDSENSRRSLEAGGKFGGSGHRLRGGTIFFSAFRQGPGSLQIIIGRGGEGGEDDIKDISTSGGGPTMSPLVMGAMRGPGAHIPMSDTDDDGSRTLRAERDDEQQGVQPAAAVATPADEKPFPPVDGEKGEGGDDGGDSSSFSSSSSSSFVDDLLSILLTPHGVTRPSSPFLADPAKLILARAHGIRAIEDGTTEWLSRSRLGGSVGEEKYDDGSISEREVVTTAAAAAAEAAGRGLSSSKGGHFSSLLLDDGGRDDDATSSPFLRGGGFAGNNDLELLSSKVFRFPGVYSWRARDGFGGVEEEGSGEDDGMVFRDVVLVPRRGEEGEEEEEGGGVLGIVRCVEGWWRQLATWAAGVGRSMIETVLQYQGSVEDCAVFALATAVPMALLLLIVHVVARCTYEDEEEEGDEEEEDDDDDDEEGGQQQQGSRTVVVVTANSAGNDDVRTPLLDNRLYRGEDPSADADEARMSKLEATVVDYNPPNPADMTRGV